MAGVAHYALGRIDDTLRTLEASQPIRITTQRSPQVLEQFRSAYNQLGRIELAAALEKPDEKG